MSRELILAVRCASILLSYVIVHILRLPLVSLFRRFSNTIHHIPRSLAPSRTRERVKSINLLTRKAHTYDTRVLIHILYIRREATAGTFVSRFTRRDSVIVARVWDIRLFSSHLPGNSRVPELIWKYTRHRWARRPKGINSKRNNLQINIDF